ncbi:Probable dual-specificity RNA methyltransferase RlmN 1 [Chlamydiales bacterium SCGC AG-110-P3]|nr:Probable dual-specificity RNA methyltransferase RlmN 1 [Chlamydiales bacterium SCGC AG-110-P3]
MLQQIATPVADPFAITSAAFADLVKNRLGKGGVHSSILYHEWWQRGTVTGSDPAFKNAPRLLEDIRSLARFEAPNITTLQSQGATIKFLLRTHDGLDVESVLIPMQAGTTLCVSSQVGCRLGCAFCETGRMGLIRNLTVSEITGQLFAARHLVDADVRNIVFMGMGEPFDNYDNVIQAIRVMTDAHGGGLGPRHISVSTVGRVDGIDRLLEEADLPINLAVSVNASTDVQRNRLMPINRRYAMDDIYNAIQRYNSQTGRHVMVAYVLLAAVNDGLDDADALAKFLVGLDVKINLIPYNPQSRDRYQPPPMATIEAFKTRLHERDYQVLLRKTKGSDIMAACGQLGNLDLRKTACRKQPVK